MRWSFEQFGGSAPRRLRDSAKRTRKHQTASCEGPEPGPKSSSRTRGVFGHMKPYKSMRETHRNETDGRQQSKSCPSEVPLEPRRYQQATGQCSGVAAPVEKSALVMTWKAAASVEIDRLMSSHRALHSSCAASASVTLLCSLAPSARTHRAGQQPATRVSAGAESERG